MPTEDELTGTPLHNRPPRPSPTRIGNRKLSAQSLMLGYGFDPELSEGSLKPPIFLTSTFVFESGGASDRPGIEVNSEVEVDSGDADLLRVGKGMNVFDGKHIGSLGIARGAGGEDDCRGKKGGSKPR